MAAIKETLKHFLSKPLFPLPSKLLSPLEYTAVPEVMYTSSNAHKVKPIVNCHAASIFLSKRVSVNNSTVQPSPI